ncbi:hypothetical protein C6A37_06825 [Desulfobacteraceae bacterium SEEP-SAG9]|nr:hypothetical protein C6A37_06825 [Desulfobacteraceae bacterium SEEP-SAG9]
MPKFALSKSLSPKVTRLLTFYITYCRLIISFIVYACNRRKKMKFISVRDLRLKPSRVWELAKQEKDLIITANGRPVAILTGVNEETFSEELDAIQRARALKALDSLHKASVLKGTNRITDNEIQSEINAVRKEKEL